MLGEGFSMGWGEGFSWAGRIFFVGWRSFSGGRRFSCLFSDGIQSPHLSSPPFPPFFPCRKHRLTRTQSAFSPVVFSPLFTGEDFGGELWNLGVFYFVGQVGNGGIFLLWDPQAGSLWDLSPAWPQTQKGDPKVKDLSPRRGIWA